MRLVSYANDRSARCGIQLGNAIYDASAVAQATGLSVEYQSTDWSKTKEVIARSKRSGVWPIPCTIGIGLGCRGQTRIGSGQKRE
jgi:hypothetical protein